MLSLEILLKNGEFLTNILLVNPEGLDREVLKETGNEPISKPPIIKINEDDYKQADGSIISCDQYLTIIIFKNDCSTITNISAIKTEEDLQHL